MGDKLQETHLKGISLSPGVALAKPFFLGAQSGFTQPDCIEVKESSEEIKRFRKAIADCSADLAEIKQKLEVEKIYDGVQIIESHLHILHDPMMTTRVEERIESSKLNAEYVFYSVILEYQRRFEKSGQSFVRNRFKDIKDLALKVMGYLKKCVKTSLGNIDAPCILVSHEFSLSEIAEIDSNKVLGLITHEGSSTSHASIVARAKGIPHVSGIDLKVIKNSSMSPLILNGNNGFITLNPSAESLLTLLSSEKKQQEIEEKFVKKRRFAAKTSDGRQIEVHANIETLQDIELVHHYGGDGIGLLRTEFLFPIDGAFPEEEEQIEVYRAALKYSQNLPIVFRTFDIGGDKLMGYEKKNQKVGFEMNPSLGCRAIRYFLQEEELLKTQLKAILIASGATETVKILFPMISNVAELKRAKTILKEVQNALLAKGVPVAEQILIGSMIEVPSAALTADLIAKESDFLSVGTNDLVQYVLAVDRGNSFLENLYTPLDPSILRLIQKVAKDAKKVGIPLNLCGEMAGNLGFTSLLIGLGLNSLSVSARMLPYLKERIELIDSKRCTKLAKEALALETSQEVKALVEKEQFIPSAVY